ncbi:MAG: sulfide/dihydroorotate dehydrogenase-like FAD/NAD-binding protein [Thermoplasmata archaeon]|nr:MAG: sulfide/dihydroorotate dehydrogenase-like FAD/NAD-binding protein [Thermoplasmata archaeon]HDH09370.1 sulfide/dihydroorotate dehydrogenase-like FAD/NAD-binding protein [Chloroflexota bacterium]
MYEILAKESLAPVTKLMVISAPEVARKAKAGQFVIIRVVEEGERIPLTIADYDREEGTITIVFQEVGKTTMHLGTLEVGDRLASFTGPLGNPTEVEHYGTVVCVGGGVGIAAVYPIARALKEAGNRVISIIGARNKELLIWEDRMRSVSDEIIVCTDDGSYGRKALVTEPLKELMEERAEEIDRVWAVGPAIMMKFCSLTTKPFGVKTIVSLNPIMVDGTGMCGSCRVEVGGETKFTCVDGPEFDGHQVDWDLLLARLRIYVEEEKRALELFKQKVGG